MCIQGWLGPVGSQLPFTGVSQKESFAAAESSPLSEME
jgi:hypothetical protein